MLMDFPKVFRTKSEMDELLDSEKAGLHAKTDFLSTWKSINKVGIEEAQQVIQPD